MQKLQPLSAKIGEIKFRRKLTNQHLRNDQNFKDEPNRREILSILKERVKKTRKIFRKLKKKGVTLSPFLEIGAEKGQRAILAVNDFASCGYALDISLESLSSAKEFARLLGFKKLPKLVCADANILPFADNSFPFVFCFETLHHFPDPEPIVKEIHRVLAPGGIFYFGEEPIKQTLNLKLWRRGTHLSVFEKVLKMSGVLPFVSRIGKTETQHGILEEEFSFSTWQKALSVFGEVEAEIKPVFFGPKNNWRKPAFLTRLLIILQGGGIEGYGKKSGGSKKEFVLPDLVCPSCKQKLNSFSCPSCRQKYGKKEGVWIILPSDLHKKLYG